jgi:hypothetical protein
VLIFWLTFIVAFPDWFAPPPARADKRFSHFTG